MAPCLRLLTFLLAGVLGVGCGGGNGSPDNGPSDGGVDGGARPDGGLPDGAVVLPDGNVILPDGDVVLPDGGELPDGAIVLPDGNVILPDGSVGSPDGGADIGVSVDGGNDPDATVLPDLGIPVGAGELPPECYDAAGDLDLCACIRSADCASNPCSAGTRCEDDGCGGRHCIGAGHPCVDDGDCPPGGTCTSTTLGSVCRPPGPNCRDDRECPVGYACEMGDCVDRRVRCANELETCPVGYVCDLALREGQAICRRWDTPCERNETCPQPGACFDIDGDGERECVPPDLECVAATCAVGTLCGAQAGEKRYECGPLGGCGVQSCPAPGACVDYANDGHPFCAPAGSCDEHSDCPVQQLCALPHLEMTPRCVGTAIGDPP